MAAGFVSFTGGGGGGPRLLVRVRRALRVRFCGLRHPVGLGERDVERFLTSLAVERGVSGSTQNQALSALLFLYDAVLGRPLGLCTGLIRAKGTVRVPVVLSRAEVGAILREMRGVPALVAALLYGSGLRLLEALQLRVKDIDFARREIIVRSGKGDRDRRTMLPEVLMGPLWRQLDSRRIQHEADRRSGAGRVTLPMGLARKLPEASGEWAWQCGGSGAR